MRGLLIILVFFASLGLSLFLRFQAFDEWYGQGAGDLESGEGRGFVSLSPGLTETLFALGAREEVVGVTRFCLYPPETANCLSVGGLLDFNYEALAALNPRLIFMTPFHREHRAQLDHLGLSYEIVPQDTLDDIRASFLTLAQRCGRDPEGKRLVDTLDKNIATVQAVLQGRENRRVLLVTGRNSYSDRFEEVYAVSTGSFLSDLLLVAGGENCVSGSVAEYPVLSLEGMLHLDPDIIMELVAEEETASSPDSMTAWRELQILRAVREEAVHILGAPYFTIPGPRVSLVLEAFVRKLHPDLKDFVL
ncbi:MAG: ABC transporter substrate-binding protein [Candidatus Hydrogenedens sp.]|nr:ABC transporter substrate-binding protein [Candidatus Hydrogenedens sp.]